MTNEGESQPPVENKIAQPEGIRAMVWQNANADPNAVAQALGLGDAASSGATPTEAASAQSSTETQAGSTD